MPNEKIVPTIVLWPTWAASLQHLPNLSFPVRRKLSIVLLAHGFKGLVNFMIRHFAVAHHGPNKIL
jgi:hypothetical protein